MSLDALMTMTVAVLRADTDTDRYGDTVQDWTEATSTAAKAWISQRTADELLEHRNAELSEWVGFFPPTTDIAAGDRVSWTAEGLTFEVSGPPNPAWRPQSGRHHYEVPLRVVEG